VVTYLVERYWPGVTRTEAEEAEARVRQAAAATGEGPDAVRLVRVTFVPVEDTVFFFFDAPSEASVIAAGELAGVPIDRISECSDLVGQDLSA
jgi:hypothetical protein